MRAIHGLTLIATLAGATAAAPIERWDTKLKNGAGWKLFEEDIAHGGKAAFVNGEWQGNFAFQLSNCPGAGCQTFTGEILALQDAPPDDYVGAWRFPNGACLLEAREGEDRFGNTSGFEIRLRPTDGAGQGCSSVPRTLAGKYTPYWINHAKMDAP